GTTPGVQYGHSWLEIQTLNYDCCSIGFREGIVQFHQPAQPCRAGDRMATGRDAPHDGDKADEADQAEKDERERCHFRSYSALRQPAVWTVKEVEDIDRFRIAALLGTGMSVRRRQGDRHLQIGGAPIKQKLEHEGAEPLAEPAAS